MEKKIGIITFHNSVNYGAVMQTYALQEFLLENNYDVRIIDYVNDKIDSELNKRIIGNPIKIGIKYLYRKRKLNIFNKFNEKNLRLTPERNIRRKNIECLKDRFDCVITGSDQVWNLNLTENDKTYFLDFVNQSTNKIGYAVSIGDNTTIDFTDVNDCIMDFNHVSFRERAFYDFAKEKYNLKSEVCCDPTLLVKKEVFEKVISERIVKEKYIFCFMMEYKKDIVELANQLGKKYNYKIINNKNSKEFFLHCTPADFLSWIKNAEIVLTDSFHGTVFSLIFKKKFISDKFDLNKKMKLRVNDLLKEFGCERYFQEINMNNYEKIQDLIDAQINYDKIFNSIEKYSEKSRKWLINSIEEKENEKK